MSLAAIYKSRGFRRFRAVFRWVRIALWFAIFLLVVAWAYLHLIGLPDYLKQNLLDRLSERGFEVQFTSARLGWGPEVLVEDAAFHRLDRPLAPRLAAGSTKVHLNLDQLLLRRRVSVDALLISQGSLQLPFSDAASDFLAVTNVSLDLALLPNDTIRLQDGRASFHGIQLALRGTVTNFLAARKVNLWPASARTNQTPAPSGPNPATPWSPQDSLRQIAATLDKIHFTAPPRLDLNLTADGRDPDTLRADLSLQAGGIQTPWGEATVLMLTADCARPVHSGAAPFVKARLSAGAFTSPEARGKNLLLTVGISHAPGSNLLAALNLAVADFAAHPFGPARTNRLEAASLTWDGSVTLQPSPPALAAASGKLQAVRAATPWGSADSVAVTCSAASVVGFPAAGDSWGFWAGFNRWALDWQADLGKVVSPEMQLDRLLCGGSWRAPELLLTNLQATLYSGGLSGHARLDVASRELTAGGRFDFEAHRLSHLLPPVLQARLQEIQWQLPPKTSFDARVMLPHWTNWPPDWAAQLLPSLQVTGDFSVGPSSFRGLSLDSAASRFAYSNQVWDIPRFHLVRPGGEAWVDFTSSNETGGFSFIIDSHLDPAGLRPLLPEKQQPLLDEAAFAKTDPPVIHAEIRGRWQEPEKLAVHARLSATNFTARGEKVDGLEAAVDYTHPLVRLSDARLFKDGGQLAVPFAQMDWTAKKISLSNAVSSLDKNIAVRVLGPQAPEWLRVIGFDTPPDLRVNGSFVLNDESATDLHFAVTGRNFRYSKLLAGTASGQVHWTGRSVALTNVQAALYDGALDGWGVFDYAPKMGTQFRGQVSLAKIQLPLLMEEWSGKTNRLKGELEGRLAITGGTSLDKKSWTGFGHLEVNHALLWNFRLFGIFSDMLNKIIPSSGNNRSHQARADFVLTNAMISTGNLEIRSTDFRLLYRGTLNSEKQLDAVVEAKILRDTPVLGPVLGLFFSPLNRLFEYKIGGTLDAPTHRHLYIPPALTHILEPARPKTPSPAVPSAAPDKPPP
jgi:hypothetical protein